MDEPRQPRAVIRPREWQWLKGETDHWLADGLIDARQRDEIVARYKVDAGAGQRRASIVLTSLGVLVAAIAVLLVIGYNWDAIGRPAKVAMIFGAVAAAFAVSTVAYARGRLTAGELSAFAGTLLYGNAIWLLAQVYQIRSHYPNGALWWTIGALAAAHLLSSRLIAFEAVVLSGLWFLMEFFAIQEARFLYVPMAVVTIWLAYRVRSSFVLALSGIILAAWTATAIGVPLERAGGTDGVRIAVAVTAMLACAFYAAGLHHRDTDAFRAAWQNTGLFVLLILFAALMTKGFHEIDRPSTMWAVMPWRTAVSVLGATLALALFVALTAVRRAADMRRMWPMFATFSLMLVWLALFMFAPATVDTAVFSWGITIAFSAAAVSIGVTMILTGVRGHRGWQFAGGIAYILVFLLVRWVDLLGSMLWSALFLAVTAAALFALARLWFARRPIDSHGVA